MTCFVSDKELVSALQENLHPEGDESLVCLRMKDEFYLSTFLDSCILELQVSSNLQTTFSPLQRLGLQVLLDSANINLGEIK